ncbi:MAG: gamma-glutamylcyclotransferase [Balneolaceae bacterium]|nr:gamma-glutamylcyclotransferase [Balneolaceae bacterium]
MQEYSKPDMKYFAYGSNMSFRRLRNRIKGSRILGTYILKRHDLRFHKISDTDGSAKCDVYYTGQKTDSVYGVLYRIRKSAKQILDEIEGLGKGYEEKKVQLVSTDNHSEEEGVTYYATNIDPSLAPYRWYLEHVLKGADEAGLPNAYVQKIRKVKAMRDPDEARMKRELGIYQGGSLR